MGARPRAVLLSLALPGTLALDVLDGIVEGFVDAATTEGAALIGGDGMLSLADADAEASAAKSPDTEWHGRRAVLIRSTAALATVLLLAGPVAGLSAWAAQNLLQPAATARAAADTPALGTPRLVAATNPRSLPATAIDRGEGPERSRTQQSTVAR